jgi:hypothetical protein
VRPLCHSKKATPGARLPGPSWRHIKYDRRSGAERARAFIAWEVLDARRMLHLEAGNNAHDRERRIDAKD